MSPYITFCNLQTRARSIVKRTPPSPTLRFTIKNSEALLKGVKMKQSSNSAENSLKEMQAVLTVAFVTNFLTNLLHQLASTRINMYQLVSTHINTDLLGLTWII